ncbi:ABC transporter substrate-binding protein [Angustibacter aerolatus]
MTTTRRHRLAAVLGLAAALAGTAACGHDEQAAVASRGPATAYDAALHDRLPAAVRERGELRVVTSADYAPVAFFDEDGRTLVGSEPDLVRAVGRVLGVKLHWDYVEFPKLIDTLEAHEADLAVSGITDTAERQKTVDFVDYFTAGTSVLVQRGNPANVTGLAALCGRSVAVGTGTTQAELAKHQQAACKKSGTRLRVVSRSNAADASLALRSGEVDAALMDYPPAADLAGAARTRAHFQLATAEQYDPSPLGLAVSREHDGLDDVVLAALQQVQRSGEYAAVLKRWNVQVGALQTLTLDAG